MVATGATSVHQNEGGLFFQIESSKFFIITFYERAYVRKKFPAITQMRDDLVINTHSGRFSPEFESWKPLLHQIAQKVGIPHDSALRASAGPSHVCLAATNDRHLAVKVAQMLDEAGKLLLVGAEITKTARLKP